MSDEKNKDKTKEEEIYSGDTGRNPAPGKSSTPLSRYSNLRGGIISALMLLFMLAHDLIPPSNELLKYINELKELVIQIAIAAGVIIFCAKKIFEDF